MFMTLLVVGCGVGLLAWLVKSGGSENGPVQPPVKIKVDTVASEPIETREQAQRREAPQLLEAYLQQHQSAIACLQGMGRADGAIRKPEREVIRQYAMATGLTQPYALVLLDETTLECGKHAAMGATVVCHQTLSKVDLQRLLQYMVGVSGGVNSAHPAELVLLQFAAVTWELPLPGAA